MPEILVIFFQSSSMFESLNKNMPIKTHIKIIMPADKTVVSIISNTTFLGDVS